MSGITEYMPGDLTLTARAGTTLGEIHDATRAHGQWLALDPFGSDEGTIGATIATASAGPLATRFGAPRDLALGLEFVTGHGAVVRGGGRVVKNVAGFDLTRLLTGSWGTLGVITEVTVRLHARPEADVTLAVSPNDGQIDVGGVRSAVGRWPFVPLACEIVNDTLGRQIGVGGARGALPYWRQRRGGRRAAARDRRARRRCAKSNPSVWRALRAAEPTHRDRASAVARCRRRSSATWTDAIAIAAPYPDACVQRVARRAASSDASIPSARRLASNARPRRSPDRDRASIAERAPAKLWTRAAARPAGRSASVAHSRDTFDPQHILNPGILGSVVVTQPPPRRRPPTAPFPARRSPASAPDIDACVHCGFCLQACPTYLTLEDENDSPRGRIVLMRALLEGTLDAVERERADAHRPVPRLPCLRDRVPVRRAVRTSCSRRRARRSPSTGRFRASRA